jgi:hypothetical protein
MAALRRTATEKTNESECVRCLQDPILKVSLSLRVVLLFAAVLLMNTKSGFGESLGIVAASVMKPAIDPGTILRTISPKDNLDQGGQPFSPPQRGSHLGSYSPCLFAKVFAANLVKHPALPFPSAHFCCPPRRLPVTNVCS